MAKFVSDLDVNQNQIKNGRFESLGSDPSTGNFEGRLFYNSTEKVIKWRTDAGVRKALHAVTSSTTALTSSESNGSISLSIADASGSASGLLSTTNFNLLTGATSANTANAIVRRGASGEFSAGAITSSGTVLATSLLAINTAQGGNPALAIRNNTTNRWGLLLEADIGGANQGGRLILRRYDDGGTSLGDVAIFTRETGLVSFFNGLSVTGTVTATTFSGSGASLTSIPNSATTATSANTASTIVARDGSGNFSAGTITANVVTGLADPVNASDAANKGYVDASRAGLDVKASVRVATNGAGTLASSFANGQVVDGVTLATGDRILIKDQATGSENGIYTVNASGAPTRATDADSSAEVHPGMFTFVEQGTANADSGWVLTNDGTITLGTTALTFAQFSGAGQITAGAGLTKSGNTLNVGAGTGITVNTDDIQISATYAGQTSIVTLGTVTTGTWSASTILANRGGTGQTSYTVGDILYADTTTTLAKLADVATGNALISGGVGVAPSWGKIGLTTHVSGTLAVGNGGTGAAAFTTDGVVLGGATLSSTAAGTANQILRVPSAGGSPAFGSINLGSSAAVGTSVLPVANGGTNAADVVTARTNLNTPSRYSSVVPASNPATITHNLNTTDVIVEVYEVSSGVTVYCDVTRTNANTVTLGFSVAPSANQYKVAVLGVS